jgi:hypothetical protein
MKRLAIDPGDVHVGWAKNHPRVETGEWRPVEACLALTFMMTRNEVDELIIETFKLFDKNYEDQTFSKMKTSQLIGALKWIAFMFRIPVVEQDPTIKIPMRNQLRGRGITQVGKNVHQKDAELHLYYRILREGAKE